MFRIELLPARHGDCIWVEYGAADDPSRILIDAGPAPTWSEALRARLPANAHIELFVLTHIDADHIAGALPFLKEAKDVTFGDVWFNGWKHLPQSRFLSAKQGEIFSTLISDRGHPWNTMFDEGPVQVTETHMPVVELPGGMKITVLSPAPKQLDRLRRQWSAQLLKHGLAPGVHHEYRQFLAREPNPSTAVPELAATSFSSDGSIPNAASIAFLAEYDGKSVLFTGDGVAQVLSRSIGRLLEARGTPSLRLDALKVSHHGSRGNTSAALLSLLDCRQYLISSNGDIHNLPDNEAIGRIIHNGSEPHLIFNYDCSRTSHWEDRELQDEYGYTTGYGDKGHVIIDL